MSAGYTSLHPAIDGGGATSSNNLFLRAKSQTQSLYATRRPWPTFFSHPSSYSFPDNLTSRLSRNLTHFRVNYTIIILLALFLSLIYHPISMIVFIIIFLFWLLFFFSRDQPVMVCGRYVDDRVVVGVLGVLTIVGLGLTGVWLNVVVAGLVGVVIVGVHAVFRVTEDLYEDGDVDEGLVSVVRF